MSEALILDPVEFAPERVELDLSSLGLEVRLEGLDYGESSATLELVRQAIGEGATDRRWPNIECTVPLMVREEGIISLAQAANKLQAKVGLFQREGGWIRRDFDDGGGFAGSVGCQVMTAGLSGMSGWLMEHKQFANEVTLKFSRSPIWYATVEVEGTEVKGSAVRDLQWEIADMLGTAPGLIRVRVKNENSTEDLRGLIGAIESRDYSPGATAELAYEAEKLTLKGGASEITLSGASGGKAVEHASLTAGWLTILDSEIAGVGPMTHKGVRRMKFRVWDNNAETGIAQLKLEWRVLGSTTWSENRIVEAPLVGGFAIIDMGECRPELAALGDQRWEWRLVARAPEGSGKIRIDRVQILPVEQMLMVSSPGEALAAEHQSVKSPGTVEDNSSTGTVSWTNPSNAKTSDNSYATAKFTVAGSKSHFLLAKKFGFALPEEGTVTGIVVSIERNNESATASITDDRVSIIKGGTVGSVNKAPGPLVNWNHVTDTIRSFGSATDLWGETWTVAQINAEGFGIALSAKGDGLPEEGAVARVDAFTITVYYTEVQDENRVCFATRSIEMRTDGVYRQHPTDEVWGKLVPEGFLPYGPAAGLEERKVRGIVVPSQGDLGELADAGSNKLSVLPIYRPGYLFCRESVDHAEGWRTSLG